MLGDEIVGVINNLDFKISKFKEKVSLSTASLVSSDAPSLSTSPHNNSENDSLLRQILVKDGYQRSYDDILTIKSKIADMDFMKVTFSGLHPKQVDDLCRNLTLRHVPKNNVVFRQGDRGDTFYVILTGSCEVRAKKVIKKSALNGMTDEEIAQLQPHDSDPDLFIEDVALVNLRSGQFFGERALETNDPRSATVITTSHTELLCVTRDAYRKLLKTELSSFSKSVHSGTKARIIRVLQKAVELRSDHELEEVSNYLFKNVPFFRRFTNEQRIGICRNSELVILWGKTTLFKQGNCSSCACSQISQ